MATFSGTAGADSITGSGSVGFGGAILTGAQLDVVFAGDGNDTILGSGFSALYVFGGSGNDSIVGTVGPLSGSGSLLRGDDGNDTVVAALGGVGQLLDGGNGNDSLVGSVEADQILGGSGDDIVNAGSGLDTVDAGDGNNTVLGGSLFDRLYAGSGNDSIVGGNPGDTLDGGDEIFAGGGNNTIRGGAGNDSLTATWGFDSISGDEGNDRIEAGDGNNTILGGTGGDAIFAGFGNDSITSGVNASTLDGDDQVYAGAGNNTVLGGFGNDRIFATDGNDSIDGRNGNDYIEAGSGANTVNGGAGNDVIYANFSPFSAGDSLNGGEGDDIVSGTWGFDTIIGGTGNDALDGGDASDRLDGGAGNDSAYGGAGGDVVVGGRGFDRLDGGYDFDTLDYSASGLGRVVIVLQHTRVTKHVAGVIETDVIQNFENYIGTAGNDRFVGYGLDDQFTGGAGNDTIDGGEGFDTVRYDAPGVGNVNVNLLTGVALDGFGGTDQLRKFSATNNSLEMIVTGGGADTLIGDEDGNFLRGNLGADSINGGGGFDLADWSGDVDLNGDGFGAIVNLSAGAFTLAGSWGSEAGSIVVGAGRARDTSGSFDRLESIENLRGSGFRDLLIGSAESNTFRAVNGADTIDGGFGYDSVSHRSDSDSNNDGFGVVVNLSSLALAVSGFGAEGAFTLSGSTARDGWGNIDRLTSIEAAHGTFQNDLLVARGREPAFAVGSSSYYAEDRSFLRGFAGADTLRGLEANDGAIADYVDDAAGVVVRLDLGTAEDGWGTVDTLVNITGASGSQLGDLIVAGAGGSWMRGRGGDDTLQGGAGVDTANFGSAAAGVFATLDNGTVAGTAQDGDGWTDLLLDIENLTGSAFADTLVGNAENNLIYGGAGGDSLDGGAGQDILLYYFPWQTSTPYFATGVSVDLALGSAADGDGSTDSIAGFEHVVGTHLADTLLGDALANTLAGAEGNDSLIGGNGNDALLGGNGNDRLDGGLGSDRLDGGAGNDLYYVNSAFDVVVETSTGGTDTVVATASFSLGAGAEVLQLSGSSNISGTGNSQANTITGNTGANRLVGGSGNDTLSGGSGADSLVGQAGADSLQGGSGNDVFLFETAADSRNTTIDRISAFEVGLDDIRLLATPDALFAGVSPASLAFNGAVSVATAASVADVMAGINAALGGSGNVTPSGAILNTWQVNVAAGTLAGTYLFVNDQTAGALATSDMLIGLTLVGGTVLSAADLTLA